MQSQFAWILGACGVMLDKGISLMPGISRIEQCNNRSAFLVSDWTLASFVGHSFERLYRAALLPWWFVRPLAGLGHLSRI